MTDKKLDLREIPAHERHPKIHKNFEELDPGDILTIINDHEPKPLFYKMKAEIEEFDAEKYEVNREDNSKFIAKPPKNQNNYYRIKFLKKFFII